jgi:peptidoglycan hydrolase-like protein with peptidoglycan-binding domain
MPEVDLAGALKQAKSKRMFFAFVPKGSDGKLIVSKAKIPAKVIAEAKKEVGGGTPVTGKCTGPINAMEFQVAKAAPPTFAAALKKVVKRDAGLTIVAEVVVASDADAEEEDVATAGSPAAASAAPPSAAPPSAPPASTANPESSAKPSDSAAPAAAHLGGKTPAGGAAAHAGSAGSAAPSGAQGNVQGIQKALQKLGYDPGKIDGIMGPNTQGAIKKFQQASGLAPDGIVGPKTQAALAKALQGGAPTGGSAAGGGQGSAPPEASRGGAPTGAAPATGGTPAPKGTPKLAGWQNARQTAINDLKAMATKIAATKHGSAAGVLKEIQFIISKLPPAPKLTEIDKLEEFVRNDDTITAAEEVPPHFHALNIRKPLLQALEELKH